MKTSVCPRCQGPKTAKAKLCNKCNGRKYILKFRVANKVRLRDMFVDIDEHGVNHRFDPPTTDHHD